MAAAGRVILEVDPITSLGGEPVSVRASGLEPGSHASLVVEQVDEMEVNWESKATFVVDKDGVVDPAVQAPVTGSYEGVDPAGLFWSMKPVSELKPGGAFGKSLTPQKMTAHLEIREIRLAMKSFERLKVAPGVVRREIREDGIVGTLFLPEGEGERPGIIVLGGSEGGTYEPSAAMYASRGFVTLALAYFGIEDLPRELVNIPVETVDRAIGWLQAQPGVKADAIGAWGASKGAELALVSASVFPAIKAVVAKSGSAFVFEGISDEMGRVHRSSWSHNGEPLPFVPLGFNMRIGTSYFWSKMRKKPWPTEPMYSYALKRNKDHPDRVAIHVEKINGPIIMTSGGSDGVWPASLMAAINMERLEANKHPHEDVHLHYEDAGHQIANPYTPTTINYLALPGGFVELLGGTPGANSDASIDSWPKINDFLARALGLHTRSRG